MKNAIATKANSRTREGKGGEEERARNLPQHERDGERGSMEEQDIGIYPSMNLSPNRRSTVGQQCVRMKEARGTSAVAHKR